MNLRESYRFQVRAYGPLACFTRPEMKVERVSYEVMTPSAARGILEAVLWKPAINWRIHKIAVLKPVKWISFRRNEVNSFQSVRVRTYFAGADRTQRNTLALRDVDYVITASFCLSERASPQDSVRKFEDIFERRLEKGQRFSQPYLGCREFAADVTAARGEFTPSQSEMYRPLGLMFYDYDFQPDGVRPYFFEASLREGVLHIPPREQVMRQHKDAASS